jgi:hypothetical protein
MAPDAAEFGGPVLVAVPERGTAGARDQRTLPRVVDLRSCFVAVGIGLGQMPAEEQQSGDERYVPR